MTRTAFSKYAWFVTFYNVAVIVWGAVVRATGSGAGCGSHWPTCNGEVLPTLSQIETLVEFAHRLTSGFSGILVIGLVVWAFRRQGWGFTRWSAVLSLVFVIIEGGIGALLVRLELTKDNASALRAVVIGIHLVNTLILMAWLSLTAWSGSFSAPIRWQRPRGIVALLTIGVIGTMILCAAGAVTALGDTLFPSQSLSAGLAADLDANASFLIRLRVVHPVIAILTSFYLLGVGRYLVGRVSKASASRLFNMLQFLIYAQIVIGVVNITFLAPVIVQLLHLFMADLLWLAFVIMAAEMLTEKQPEGISQRALNPAFSAGD